MFGYPGIRDILTAPDNSKYITPIEKHRSGLLMLEENHIDYLLQYQRPMDQELASHPVKGLRHLVIEKFDIYFIVNKNTPDALNLMRLFETHSTQGIKY